MTILPSNLDLYDMPEGQPLETLLQFELHVRGGRTAQEMTLD